ncbi:aldehyde dehydrogenase family protein [Oryzicola mucosus]|uniref:aldehyde dehydrogenase (NAD(+)) n=1 Tax=Oryzicola mucosus TaxID=2767425 RepID=A0A8J6U1C7_9HYPH|nr:aldehyde dehydrogenase family protein [Oryzicola mucosus]MBD0416741.1 aldehyde dehydrogenase family protein [Oryzicola mucosus]
MSIWSDKGHFINGIWTGANGATPVENPTDHSIIAHISAGSTRDVDSAVAAAKTAWPAWMATPVAERAALLARVAELIEARQDDLARAITFEVGMPLKLAKMIQVGLPLQSFQNTSRIASAFPFERKVGNSMVLQEAVGVVAAITPWNYPLHQIAAKVAPALAAGCTVVLKPADLAPLNALLLADIFEAAGAPAGIFNVVTGSGAKIGLHLATHPDVDMISFTGSTRTGATLAREASAQIKRVSLELGGKSAALVLEDADIVKAVKATVNACFLNSGQTCSALTRLIVPASRKDEAVEIAREATRAFVLGDPMDPATRLGPVISEKQREGIRRLIRTAADEGGTLVTGGAEAPDGLDQGYFVKPTIFADVIPDSTLAQEEVFGPVLAILTASDDDDAVAIANNSRYGLSGSVWAGSSERATAAARLIRTGQIEINGGRFNALAPFGGFKQSGYGRELGVYGIEEFVEPKALQF